MTALAGRALAVIPARYASSRFPGKPLALIAGKPMIQWVYERTCQCRTLTEVLVATDDVRIRDCVQGFGGRVVMTSPDHPTGTDRIAEAVRDRDVDVILNVQGDEPLVPPAVLDELVQAMDADPALAMGTIAVPMPDDSPDFASPNVTKVVFDEQHRALYFSRAPIPYARNARPAGAAPCRHWGIYAYRKAFLMQFVTWPQSPLERCESLEQLRALEHGAGIYVLVSRVQVVGVDVPADVPRAEALMRQLGLVAGSPPA